MSIVGPFLGHAEHAFGIVWSIGELAIGLSRPHHLLADPDLDRVRADVEARGFHAPFDHDAVRLEARGELLHGDNPYSFIGERPRERIHAHFRRASENPRRHLVVVCHCYGVPSPWIMRTLFGLDGVDADVVTNVMSHHQPGTYDVWPGSGLTSLRVSRFIESIRSAVTGVRALIRALVRRERYETVSVLGFSIGGQLALHVAHAGDVDRAFVYCPVTSLASTTLELGVMSSIGPALDAAVTRYRGRGVREAFAMTDPLATALPFDESALHVVVQKHDALAPPHQIAAIRRKYPRAGWHEFNGTHIVPHGLGEIRRALRRALGLRRAVG